MSKNLIYDNKLKDKNISVIRLDNYINNYTQILHKCICGNEWEAQPNNILSGGFCGCKTNAKKTQNWYIKKLIDKNIEVKPIEEYINIKTKILHKCTCGNEWEITPNNVLSGQKCGCIIGPKNNTNEWYLKKLKEKGIKVIPLETYINIRTKILHKCICNSEWEVSPLSIINGNKCGCAKRLNLRDKEFYKNKETVLYYIKIKGLYKIGVTLYKNSIEESLKKRFFKQKYEVIEVDIFKDGSEAFTLEQQILEFNREYRYLGEKVLKSGNTELFIKDIR